uniref:Fibronectin type-III domain-containing protein n=1 Tax=Magallana gigas TaxID=29159 RepID=A0A8W8LD27_MAGGI
MNQRNLLETSPLVRLHRLPFTSNGSLPVVTITNDIGSGPSSSPIAFRTLEDVPGPPTIIKLIPLLNTAIVVAFAPPIDANELITKYRLSVEEEMTSYQIETDTDVTSATIKDLSAYISYHIKVKARTSIGWGACSSVRTVSFTTGIIHRYKLFYHRGTEDSERIVIYRSHSTLSQVNVTDLDSGEYYHFRVQARSGAGYGPSVNQSSFTLPARPAKPTVPIISYKCSNQRLTLKLFPNIVDEKHFYMARVYADDVSLPKAKIQEEEIKRANWDCYSYYG